VIENLLSRIEDSEFLHVVEAIVTVVHEYSYTASYLFMPCVSVIRSVNAQGVDMEA
jgi:hypothetical protein